MDAVVPDKHKENANYNLAEILSGEDLNQILHSRRKDGYEYYIELNETGIQLPQDRDGVLTMKSDITERIKAEKKLKKVNKKLEREYEKAENLHHSILPDKAPQIEGLKIAAYYEPAYRLGGDFYDFYETGADENRLIFYLSDISGHDLSSSMINVFLKDTVNTFLREEGYFDRRGRADFNLVKLIKSVGRGFQELDVPAEYFITLLAGSISVDRGKIKLCNAGFHFPPLLLREGEFIQPNKNGIPITSLEGLNFKYEESEMNFQPGDTLFAHTDGLIEQEIKSENEAESREIFGEKKLLEVLKSHKEGSPDKIIEAVNNRLEEEKGEAEIQDDLTYLVIQHI